MSILDGVQGCAITIVVVYMVFSQSEVTIDFNHALSVWQYCGRFDHLKLF